nr:hypothetical protein CFP56_00243 [Quercus suber]
MSGAKSPKKILIREQRFAEIDGTSSQPDACSRRTLMLLLLLRFPLRLDQRVESVRRENPLHKREPDPLPPRPRPRVERMPPRLAQREIHHLGAMHQHHAPEQPRLDAPRERREPGSQHPLHHLAAPEPPSLAVRQKRRERRHKRHAAEPHRRRHELGHRDLRAAERRQTDFVHLDDALAHVPVGGQRRREGDAVQLRLADKGHPVQVDAVHAAVVGGARGEVAVVLEIADDLDGG